MKRLTLTYNGKTVISDIFNFKAYRTMYDIIVNAENATPEAIDSASIAGVAAMFDGTEITEDIITAGWRTLDAAELLAARTAVLKWYCGIKHHGDASKMVGTPPEKPLLRFYQSLLDHHLPSEIDKQDPQLLFDIMAAKPGDMTSIDDIPAEMRLFYGY